MGTRAQHHPEPPSPEPEPPPQPEPPPDTPPPDDGDNGGDRPTHGTHFVGIEP